MSDEGMTHMNTDVITAEEFETRVVDLFVKGGPMGVPRTRHDQQILMKSAALTLDRAREYDAPQAVPSAGPAKARHAGR